MSNQLQDAIERIRHLNIELGRDPQEDPFLRNVAGNDEADEVEREVSPVLRAASFLSQSIKKRIFELEQLKNESQESLALHQRILDKGDSRHEDISSKRSVEEAEKIGLFKTHIRILEQKLERLECEPENMFLPLGTVVRFTGSGTYQFSDRLTDDRKTYPVAGTVGVVTGLKHEGEFSIAVSVRKDFTDGWGDLYSPSYEWIPTYRVDPDMLEIIGYGTLPDGTECDAYGWSPTHEAGNSHDADRLEMIIEADGYFWRLWEFEDRGVECLMACEDMSEYSWITNVIVSDVAASPVP